MDTFEARFSGLAAFPIRNLKMAVHWVPSFGFPIAWPGLDQNGCNGLQGNCTAEGGTKLQFRRKIKILSAYPPVGIRPYNEFEKFNTDPVGLCIDFFYLLREYIT